MKRTLVSHLCFPLALAAALGSFAFRSPANELAQVPTWSRQDLDFFLHGSMSTEFVPETVLRAFMKTYPDLFPKEDFSHLGAIPDPQFGWPIGFSRKEVPHLGGLPAVGINCASCHVGEVTPVNGGDNLRILGGTAQFDVESFFGAVIVSTFRTADPANMRKFLTAYLALNDAASGAEGQKMLEAKWQQEASSITAAMTKQATDETPGLRPIAGKDLRLSARSLAEGTDLPVLATTMLNLFHNLRFALHLPDTPPPPSPPNGPGRNDPWRILSYSLLGVVTEPAQVKFGIVWNADQRHWVHYDGNTRSPIIRNLAASLGLGAPLVGKKGVLAFPDVQRHTALSEVIRPPRYPWEVDREAAARGKRTYSAACASCHDAAEGDARLYLVTEIGTDPNRAKIFAQPVADGFNQFFAELQIDGYKAPNPPAIRSTQKYWAPSLAGVWARAPYLHNGSVRTLWELLTPPGSRAKSYKRGSRVYDPKAMGYADEGSYALDSATPGNSNSGHDYGTQLSEAEKRDLIEHLKTL